ncbi:MAG: hypothetical protein H0X24_21065 [Ktedonobacterales bacterium]|nr:hypothetical protein [Ktedonobacterales bacterium]
MLEYSVVFHRASGGKDGNAKGNTIDEIFVVPVCSILSITPRAYLDFLLEAGALHRAADVVAAANLRRRDTAAAETLRREVRSILTAAEVDALTPPLPPIAW